MRLSSVVSETSTTITEHEITAEELAGITHTVGPKRGSAFMPALFDPLIRAGDNVTHMTALCLDFDHGAPIPITSPLHKLFTVGWHSHSHTPEAPRARIVIPFKEPLAILNASDWSKRIWPALVDYFQVREWADPACCDPARLFFDARKPSEESPHKVWHSSATELFDAENFVAALQLGVVPPPPIVSVSQISRDETRAVSLEGIRNALSNHPEVRVQRLIKGLALSPPPDKREPHEEARHIAWLKATGALSLVLEGWESSTAVLEGICRPSYNAEVAASPNDHTAWEGIVKQFENARLSAAEYKAKQKAARERMAASIKKAFGVAESIASGATTAVAAQAAEIEEDSEEMRQAQAFAAEAQYRTTKSGTTLRPIGANVAAILTHLAPWKDVFRFNATTNDYEVWPMPGNPLPYSTQVRPLADSDVTWLSYWLAREPGVNFFNIQQAHIRQAIIAVAELKSYDPLKEYLNGLHWDGVPRLENMLTTYFGVIDDAPEGRAALFVGDAPVVPGCNYSYVKTVAHRWLISAVARGIEPGVKHDDVVILEGEQGAGKTTALQIFGGIWYTASKIDIYAKDTFLITGKNWIVEMGEIGAFKRQDDEGRKDYLSKNFDEFRKPFGHVPTKVMRRCIFVGTTNEKEYLTDPTGNRRYLPVWCQLLIDIAGLRRDKDQLFAEAVHLYRLGVRHWFRPEEVRMFKRHTDARMVNDIISEQIEEKFLEQPPEKRPSRVRTVDVVKLIGETAGSASRGLEGRVGRAMKLLGFKKSEGVGRYYEVPRALLDAPKLNGSMSDKLAAARLQAPQSGK